MLSSWNSRRTLAACATCGSTRSSGIHPGHTPAARPSRRGQSAASHCFHRAAWTSSFLRSGAFEISSSDVRFVAVSDIKESPHALKAFALGTPRDRLLLRQISDETLALAATLEKLNLKFVTGVQLLTGDRKDAS